MASDQRLRVATWNINGIRSFSNENFKKTLDSLDADIICVQETKVTLDFLDEKTAFVEGYESFFSFCRSKSGYSGVATFCKEGGLPTRAEEGLTGILVPAHCKDAIGCRADLGLGHNELRSLDAEGRAVITQHCLPGDEILTIFNVYCPRVDPDQPNRLAYKLKFYQQMYARAQALCNEMNSFVLIVGDLNCSHKDVDSCDPGNLEEFYANPSRQWLDQVLQNNDRKSESEFKLVDTYRHLHPEVREAYTCWNTRTGARNNNYGTRIDYVLCDQRLAEKLKECDILSEVMGSDHCPVRASFSLPPCVAPLQLPSLCTKFLPEFSGTQQKLFAFLKPSGSSQNTLVQKETVSQKKKTSRQSNLKDFFGAPVSKMAKIETSIAKTDRVESSNGNTGVDEILASEVAKVKTESVNAWKALLGQAPSIPMCSKHKEKCVVKTSKKPGPNLNRQFYSCPRSAGSASDPEANCNFFQWVRK